jgi:hypothetical protein
MVQNFVKNVTQKLVVSIAFGLPAFKTAFLPLDTTQTNFTGTRSVE